ncbi:MAG: cob(I)alamin adenosyltransferase [Eubacteriales bacterium]|nr:cob(I)alamin adenosyltransferase [Eubacteriales bacterium]
MERPRLSQGLTQIYTGNSKGKTTAALGLALRAIGHGFKVYIIQFMKGTSYYGELYSLARLYPDITVRHYGRACPIQTLIKNGEKQCTECGQCFVEKGKIKPEDREMASMALAHSREILFSDQYDIVILDEILNALYFELVTLEDVKHLIKGKPPLVELVLTGRYAPVELIEMADQVTEMKEIKHPFQKGILARRGIEY